LEEEKEVHKNAKKIQKREKGKERENLIFPSFNNILNQHQVQSR